MEDESGVTRIIIDEYHFSDIQRDQMEGDGDVTRSIIDELHSLDIQVDQMESEGAVTRRIINELHSSISKESNWEVKVALLEVSFMNFILSISQEIK